MDSYRCAVPLSGLLRENEQREAKRGRPKRCGAAAGVGAGGEGLPSDRPSHGAPLGRGSPGDRPGADASSQRGMPPLLGTALAAVLVAVLVAVQVWVSEYL